MPTPMNLFSMPAKRIEASVLKLADDISHIKKEEEALKMLNELEKYGALGFFLKGNALLNTNCREAYKCFKMAEFLFDDSSSKKISKEQIGLIKSEATFVENLLKVKKNTNGAYGDHIKSALHILQDVNFDKKLINENLQAAHKVLIKTLAREELEERYDIDMPPKLPKGYEAKKRQESYKIMEDLEEEAKAWLTLLRPKSLKGG